MTIAGGFLVVIGIYFSGSRLLRSSRPPRPSLGKREGGGGGQEDTGGSNLLWVVFSEYNT